MTQKKEHKYWGLELGVYALFLGFYAWLAYNTPFTADDWNWGSDVGLQWLVSASQNSRYAGNLLIVLMTRCEFLRILIMAGTVYLIGYMIAHKASTQISDSPRTYRLFFFLVTNTLFFTADSQLWSETIGWTAGFANFGISAVFFLLCLSAWEPLLRRDYSHEKSSASSCFITFVCVFVGQLFTENLTIAVVILAILANVLYFRKLRHINEKYALMLLGALFGLAAMFSSSLYDTLFTKGEAFGGYRQILFLSKTSAFDFLYSVIFQIARLLVRLGEENLGLTLALLLLLTIQLWIFREERIYKVCIITNLVLSIYYVISIFREVHYGNNMLWAILAGIINGIYMCTVSTAFLLLYKKRTVYAGRHLILWGCALLTLLPLLATSENGSRLFFTCECLEILLVLTMFAPWVQHLSPQQMKRLNALMLAIAILLCLRFVVIYSANGACARERREIIAQALEGNEKNIVLPIFPYTDYAGRATPASEEALIAFKNFYAIPHQIEVSFR